MSAGNKDLSTGDKGLSTEQKNLSTDNKGLSTETSTSKETKHLESVIKNLTELKRNLENGNMEKLEQLRPDKYVDTMYKLKRQMADKNGSDYFGSAEDVQVLIDKYKADLDVLKAENSGAQRAVKGVFEENGGTAENPATQADVDSYIEYALEYGDKKKNGEEAEKQKDSIAYGKASERLVSDMQELYGVDVEGKSHVLNDNDIRHIDNSHGRGNSKEKYPVTANDLKQIPDIVENYDNVYYVERENGQNGIYYEKRHNGTTYYLEAVKNGETLSNKQMIKVGTGTIPDIRGLRKQIKERRAASSAPDGTAPRMYVQDAWNNSSSNKNIPQNGSNVKPGNEYSSEYQNGAEHPQ